MIPLILLLPLAAAIIIISVMRTNMAVRYVALAASIASLVLLPLLSYGTVQLPWFSVGAYKLSITTTVAPINMLLLGIVLFIGVLIMLYSIGFMDKRSEQKRFYLEMLSFEAAMLAFAMSGNFILFFIAWEFLSLTSYLLIGFWYKDRPARAARTAITIIVIGDIALLAAMVTLFVSTGTLEFGALISGVQTGLNVARLSMLLLVLAIMTKSAQIPFQEWLPDAMEGPTPVSAYLHSTTMVKAGVFAAIVLSPIFVATGTVWLFLPIGIATAIIAMSNAMREFQIKRVVAYSTVQELALMLAAVGAGAIPAAIYLFFAQAFYKALLFFNSGAVMKATGKEDLRDLSGLSRNKLIYITTIFGVLAAVGFIPFDGFFANTAMAGAFSTNLIVYAIISLITLGTSFYIFRWLSYISTKTANTQVMLNYEGQPRSMLLGALILAPLTLLASLGYQYLPLLFHNPTNILPYTSAPPISMVDAVIEMAAVIIGAVVAYLVYSRNITKAKLGALNYVAYNSAIFRLIYKYFAVFVCEIGDGIALFDSYLSDALDLVGKETVRSGLYVRKAAIGRINQYALIVAIALIVVFAYFYITVH